VSVRLLLATADDVDALVAMNGLVQDLHADLSPQIFRRDWDRADHICVTTAWRGRGIGSRLLAAADDFAREMGASSVLLDVWHENIVGRKAFERTGFTPLNLLMSRRSGLS